jgi:hypothetical protein
MRYVLGVGINKSYGSARNGLNSELLQVIDCSSATVSGLCYQKMSKSHREILNNDTERISNTFLGSLSCLYIWRHVICMKTGGSHVYLNYGCIPLPFW